MHARTNHINERETMARILDAASMPDADASLLFDMQQQALRQAHYALRAVLIETDGGVHGSGKPYSTDSYLPCVVVVTVREALEKCEEFLA